ncbi:hypothetical protein DL771_008351 [Monosporascus sp. 5C6A]|nr:hypothetical protein DL771_008351 [Monosporascus sp. 5C6A]
MLSHRPQRTAAVSQDRSPSSFGWLERETSPSDISEVSEEFVQDAQRFAKALDALSIPKKSLAEKRTEIFRLVDVYYRHAVEKVHTLRGSRRQPPRSSLRRLDDTSSQDSMDLDDAENGEESPALKASLQYWKLEAQTWDMLRRLLPLRYSNRNALKPSSRDVSRFQNTSEIWDDFLRTDPAANERKAVLECLQASADESRVDLDELVREYQQRAERGDIIAHGWLHTRSAIKMQKNINGWSGTLDPSTSDAGQMLLNTNGTEPLVTQLDPDVASRQGRKLQPQDEYFERAIWLGCYELLRRGRSISEIRDWCIERTEVWRAVSMSAMPLSRGEEQERVNANPLSTILWRRTCFALARQGGTDDYERAVYGILSGDIPSVEKICLEWDDFVFAHYNALLRSQFDAYLMKRSTPDATASVTQSLPSFNAVQFHGDSASVGKRIVESLESHPKTAAEARTPMKSLQAAIISDNLDQYIYEFGLVLGEQANGEESSALIPKFGIRDVEIDASKFFRLDSYRGLRILVHIYILITSLEDLDGNNRKSLTERHRAQENVLSAYASALRLNDMTDLLPLYCSKLEGDRAFFTLGRNVSNLVDPDAREMLLRIMEKLGMDIAKFVQFQPESLLRQYPDVDGDRPVLGGFTVFSNEPPTLKYGRPLKPDFFGEVPDNLNPVDEQLIQSLEWFLLVDGLWHEIFSVGTVIYKRFLNITWFEDVRSGAASSAFEENSLGMDEITAARNYFEMECLVRSLDSMETIASSAGLARDPTEELDRNFWAQIGSEVKGIKSFMQPLLSNWLVESVHGKRYKVAVNVRTKLTGQTDDPDFSLLRDAYLPETIIGYVSVLHFAGTSLSRDNLLECMELAAVIAKKDSDVAAVLMKCGRMKEVVEGFANCSKALAISGSEKKASGGSSKKLREMGWTRELWSVKR